MNEIEIHRKIKEYCSEDSTVESRACASDRFYGREFKIEAGEVYLYDIVEIFREYDNLLVESYGCWFDDGYVTVFVAEIDPNPSGKATIHET